MEIEVDIRAQEQKFGARQIWAWPFSGTNLIFPVTIESTGKRYFKSGASEFFYKPISSIG